MHYAHDVDVDVRLKVLRREIDDAWVVQSDSSIGDDDVERADLVLGLQFMDGGGGVGGGTGVEFHEDEGAGRVFRRAGERLGGRMRRVANGSYHGGMRPRQVGFCEAATEAYTGMLAIIGDRNVDNSERQLASISSSNQIGGIRHGGGGLIGINTRKRLDPRFFVNCSAPWLPMARDSLQFIYANVRILAYSQARRAGTGTRRIVQYSTVRHRC